MGEIAKVTVLRYNACYSRMEGVRKNIIALREYCKQMCYIEKKRELTLLSLRSLQFYLKEQLP